MSWSGRKVGNLKRLVMQTYGTTCWLCGAAIHATLHHAHPASFTVDHVLPRSRGGNDDITNLRPAHRSCNLARGAQLVTARRPTVVDREFLEPTQERKPRPPSVSSPKLQKNG